MITFAQNVWRFAAAKKIVCGSSRRKQPAPKHTLGGESDSWDVKKKETICAGLIEMGPPGTTTVNVGSAVRAVVLTAERAVEGTARPDSTEAMAVKAAGKAAAERGCY